MTATPLVPSRAAARELRVFPWDAHNQRLVANTHPSDWVNPQPRGRYNLVVLGGGTAGLVTAAGAAGLGARVALIERHLLGGDCLNVGCVPSKALLRAARAAAEARDAPRFGVHTGTVDVDFAAVMERVREVRARLSPHDSAARFRDLGVDVYLGEGRFVTPNAVEVDGRRLEFARAVVATGARPAAPPVPGLAEAGFRTNEDVFELTELPRRLLVLGAGPIGCELAQAFARLGSSVWVADVAPRVLPRDDADAAAIVRKALEADGVRWRLATELTAVEGGSRGKRVRLGGEAGETLEMDEILVAAGRRPNVEGLGLEAAGVEYDLTDGVRVDAGLRTTNPAVYAAGDVCSTRRFTHLSDAHARLAIRNALFPGRARAGALVLPWCTYTDPEVAHVGITADEAAARGPAVRTLTHEMRHVDRAVLEGEDVGFARVHLRAGSDRILGATIVDRHAGELVSEITLAMVAGAGLEQIGATIHPYPTRAEALRKLADAHRRSRLTPRVKRWIDRWMGWRR